MARIPEQEIERLKSEVAVERLVEASGVALRRAGKDLLGKCLFHEDAEASHFRSHKSKGHFPGPAEKTAECPKPRRPLRQSARILDVVAKARGLLRFIASHVPERAMAFDQDCASQQ